MLPAQLWRHILKASGQQHGLALGSSYSSKEFPKLHSPWLRQRRPGASYLHSCHSWLLQLAALLSTSQCLTYSIPSAIAYSLLPYACSC